MGEKLFPIQNDRGAKPHPLQIPWSIAELAYSVYSSQYGRGQTLERLAQRGGFGAGEMDMYLPDWRERCDKNAELTRQLATVTAERDEARAGYAALDKNWCTLHDMMGNAIRGVLNMPGASVSELVEAIENLKGRQ